MKIFNLTLTLITILFFAGLTAANINAQIVGSGGRLLTVNDNGDTNDTNPGDTLCLDANGKCTLRAAIQETNALGFNVIDFALPPASVINLTLGELSITKLVNIIGPGARNLTVQRSTAPGTSQFRVFHIGANVGLNLIIRGFKVKNGSTDADGGAFYIESGNSVRMTELAVSSNAANRGAGIANAGTLNLTRSLISSNSAVNAGGGVINIGGDSAATISDSTLTENSAANGGAVYNQGSLLLVNNTITQNAATQFGSSIVSAASGTVNVLNTIVGMDTASTVSSLWGAFISMGNNLITDARNSTGFTNGTNGDQVSNNNAINPLLGNLADNGGQTDTRALLDGSPAINHGNNCVYNATCAQPLPQGFKLSYDQRTNFLRQGGATVDVGAFEMQQLVISGTVGFGAFGFRNRMGGILLILTNARTNEKRYRTTNPFGNFLFSGLNQGDVFILERRGKRAGTFGVMVLEFDSLPVLVPSVSVFEDEGIKIIRE